MSAPDGTNLPEERSMSVEEENEALVRRLIEANANADLDTLDKLLDPDFVDRSLVPGQEPGREGFKEQIAEEHAIFSNTRINIEDQVAAEGDKMITRLTRRRIHDRGEYGVGSARTCGGRCNGQGCTCSAGDVHNLRHVAARRASVGFLLAW